MHAFTAQSVETFPLDLSIDLNSVKAEIHNCKRRFHRDLWTVLCSKALGAAKSDNAWKKGHRDEESVSRGQGAGTAKQADTEDEEGVTDEDQTGHNDEIDALNENNRSMIRRRWRRTPALPQPQRQYPSMIPPRHSTRHNNSSANGNSSRRGPVGRPAQRGPAAAPSTGTWNNWNNHFRQQRQQDLPLHSQVVDVTGDWSTAPPVGSGPRSRASVGFCDRPADLWRRQQRERRQQQRLFFESASAAPEEDDEELSSSDEVGAAATGCCVVSDAESCGPSGESSGSKFVPIFCGSWNSSHCWERQEERQEQQQKQRQQLLADQMALQRLCRPRLQQQQLLHRED